MLAEIEPLPSNVKFMLVRRSVIPVIGIGRGKDQRRVIRRKGHIESARSANDVAKGEQAVANVRIHEPI